MILCAVAGVLAAGCGTSPPPGAASITNGLPRAVAGRSVHFEEVTKSGRNTDTLTADLGPTDGSERLLEGRAEFDVVRVSGTIYVRTNAPDVLTQQVGLSAKAAAQALGKWVSLRPSDGPYSRINQDLSIAAQVASFTPVQPGLRVGSQINIRTIPALPVAGTPPPSTLAGGTGSVSLFVSPTAPHLPVGATLDLTTGTRHEAVAAAFTHWGERVHEVAPATSVSFKSASGA